MRNNGAIEGDLALLKLGQALFLMRSGVINFQQGLNNTLRHGSYISGGIPRSMLDAGNSVTAKSSNYYLRIEIATTNLYYTNDHWFPYPLRCLSTAVEGEEKESIPQTSIL